MLLFALLLLSLYSIMQAPTPRLSWATREDGAALVEYAFLIMLIAIVAAASVGATGTAVLGLYQRAAAMFP